MLCILVQEPVVDVQVRNVPSHSNLVESMIPRGVVGYRATWVGACLTVPFWFLICLLGPVSVWTTFL